ncbi:MAG: hypothetical protein DWQ34_26985 [Planctomycetota bacterium]|nr:MAG: hypothetical protein DWQ29_13605 [Planctomycetota bacterium]REJ86620.1 MAG: hypothetical protein DWQ34_26985 [Planctomycetota bacterium]REK28461.1 MAG: hypothetical protein DWQ41_05785 [Planctomycetota bacterium]REK29120.1 MAG: hypothetical protein DWQ45_23550 [Planctomycetota bacterium]
MSVNYESRLPAESADAPESQDDILARGCEFSRQLMDEHPLATTLGVFGIGLGVGTIVGSLLADQRFGRSSRAEALGDRVLSAVRDALPDQMRSYLS